ncbi:MAG: D-alanyl-D-alanine carboxypeptidase/D-alanyl-D-alanine-endopeptidase [Acidobacteria bacterium]|nr:D-alanyl-D-alanine carboxypeptidase/D-alanyl-D-alanine-endopeptidase [Acidobacteriota bacterium]
MKNDSHTKRRRRLLLISSALLPLILIFSLIFLKPQMRAQEATAPTREESARTDADPTPQKSAPLSLSNAPADVELQRKIDEVIATSGLDSARWGVFVQSLRDGRALYGREASKLFVPASNMKVYTTAVALDLLGTDYRWRTSVYAAREPDRDGLIDGDLTLYGRGAPDLKLSVKGSRSSLGELADELYRRGVRRVRGGVIGDESYFRGEPLGDGWLWNDVQWYFGAEVSALSIGGNEVSLTLAPAGKVGDSASLKLEPETDYVRVVNDAQTAESGQPTTMGINRGLSDNVFRVWGEFPLRSSGFRARLAVHQPALWAAQLFRAELRARGITVEGEARTKDARVTRESERFDPQSAVELAHLDSRTLGETAHEVNKESLNLEAELILRTLGKERGATAPSNDPRRMLTRGDDEAGLAVVRRWLETAGIRTAGLGLHDGSGLSRLDLVTPEATVRLLAAIRQSRAAQSFLDSLPIAGRDGTLRSRLRAASGRIRAKTGTLATINSLSGYVETDGGETLAFSIICNDETTPSSSIPVIDSIARLLAAYRQK